MKQLEQFYEEYKDELFRYLCWLCGNSSEAEELLQETFVQAIGALPRFRGEASLKTWIYAIARRQWLKRKHKQRSCSPLEEAMILASDVEEQYCRKEAFSRAQELLKTREERAQRAVWLRWQGYSFAEIGQALCLQENSARVLEYRTRRWLREQLEKEGVTGEQKR